jgi:SAM-dependent methyltransferase
VGAVLSGALPMLSAQPMITNADLPRTLGLHEFDSMQAFLQDPDRDARWLRRSEVEAQLAVQVSQRALRFYCALHAAEAELEMPSLRNRALDIDDWREQASCPVCRVNARVRLGLMLVQHALRGVRRPDVYLTEQASFAYLLARRLWPRTVGSEFVVDPMRRKQLTNYLRSIGGGFFDRVRFGDVTRLGFIDHSFDAIASFEVLEHVPDWQRALREFARVLKPGGTLILTAPFLDDRYETLVRARLTAEGAIEHLLAPEYHGDTATGAGVLCYQQFGWDLLDVLRECGFAKASSTFAWAPAHGLIGLQGTIVARMPS